MRARPRIEGIARGDDAYDVLGRAPADSDDACTGLSFRIVDATTGDARVDVDVVDHAAFTELRGDEPPAPLDPAAGYRGHRLP